MNSNYCSGCHSGIAAPIDHSHYSGWAAPAKEQGITPLSNQINDNSDDKNDYPSNAVEIVICETCHSVHHGVAAPLIRAEPNTLCLNCHDDYR